MAKEIPKDLTPLYNIMGRVIFDSEFRELIYEDPDLAGQKTGVDKGVIEQIQMVLETMGKDRVQDLLGRSERALAQAVSTIIFCART